MKEESTKGRMQTEIPVSEPPPARAVVRDKQDILKCFADMPHQHKWMPLRVSVSDIRDFTARRSEMEGGYVPASVAYMAQTVLMDTNFVTVVDRINLRVLEIEHKYGNRGDADKNALVRSDVYLTGAISSISFIPGANVDVRVLGVGPYFRQSAVEVELDLQLVHTQSSQVLAQSAVKRQFRYEELGFAGGRFLGDVLASGDVGEAERQMMQAGLRAALELGVAELLVNTSGKINRRDGRYSYLVPEHCTRKVKAALAGL